jgi:hypothetical protein
MKTASHKQFVERLQSVVEHLHGCRATWLESVPVKETFEGQTVWDSEVEVYALTGHPKAQRCYGWSYGDPEQFITILELPPVKSAHDAVKVGVAYQAKKAGGRK